MGMFKLNSVRSDIMPIVNYAWARSFNNVATNKKAIRNRGWGPLHKILLQHPEISCLKSLSDKQQNLNNMGINNSIITKETSPLSSQDMTSKVEIEDINFNTGYAGEVIQTIL